jgi:nitrogen fixation protein FixH
MGNVHVAEQTETTAEVRTYMMITAAPPASEGGKFTPLTSGTYNASLEKRDGKWIITRWYIEVDAPVNASEVPKGFDSKEMQLIPDTSCQKK